MSTSLGTTSHKLFDRVASYFIALCTNYVLPEVGCTDTHTHTHTHTHIHTYTHTMYNTLTKSYKL